MPVVEQTKPVIKEDPIKLELDESDKCEPEKHDEGKDLAQEKLLEGIEPDTPETEN